MKLASLLAERCHATAWSSGILTFLKLEWIVIISKFSAAKVKIKRQLLALLSTCNSHIVTNLHRWTATACCGNLPTEAQYGDFIQDTLKISMTIRTSAEDLQFSTVRTKGAVDRVGTTSPPRRHVTTKTEDSTAKVSSQGSTKPTLTFRYQSRFAPQRTVGHPNFSDKINIHKPHGLRILIMASFKILLSVP